MIEESLVNNISESPFHAGEQWFQERVGVREAMERFGRRVIRDHLPDQHRAFYQKLPFLLLGYSDQDGWPWVSVVAGKPGFIRSPNDKTLEVVAPLMSGDPLRQALRKSLPVGGLGMEPRSRRRNRFSMDVASSSESQLSLSVRQSFGNCPQYIQAHQVEYSPPTTGGSTEQLSSLDDDAVALIRRSDTFFVSSQTLEDDATSSGADVSHRGGKPGFVKVEEQGGVWKLTVPDYPGNNHFNTLGNFLVNPRAGLLFWDIESQDVLMLTGDVEILHEHEELAFFEGAERFWQFTLNKAVRLKGQLPLQGQLGEYSPNTLMTGDWESARLASKAHQLRHAYQPYRVIAKKQESDTVMSFYLKPESGSLPSFKAGQFITIKMPLLKDRSGRDMIRTYTVSSAPSEDGYRISVKRQRSADDEDGIVSNYLHDVVGIDDRLEVKAPQGDFHWQEDSDRPVVLLAAGIGITPMVSMLRHALREQVRVRRFQNITLVVTARHALDQVFRDEISNLQEAAQGYLRVCWCFTQPDANSVKGRDFQVEGRPNTALLQSLLPLADYDFYLCGPGMFMQDMHASLSTLGVAAKRIFSESFGPSSIAPVAVASEHSSSMVAASAGVQLEDENGEQLFVLNWQAGDGNLLEFSEAHGVTPPSGCRNGRCGSCRADLIDGDVVYAEGCQAPAEGGVLLCCTQPAIGGDLAIRLRPES